MAMIKKIFLILFTVSMWSQNHDQVIEIKYNLSKYKQIALDSISVLMQRQQSYYQQNKFETDSSAMCFQYRLSDLDYLIVPKFRLYKDASTQYTCGSSIEPFIVFNEPCKYMNALPMVDKTVLCIVNIPNEIFEYQRIYNPDVYTISLRNQYVSRYLDEFKALKPYIYKLVQEKPQNFFFELYGLTEVLFEIETASGLLYANYSGGMPADEETPKRMPANEYLHKYIGEQIIKELANGNYKNIDGWGSVIEYKPCQVTTAKEKPFVLKILR